MSGSVIRSGLVVVVLTTILVACDARELPTQSDDSVRDSPEQFSVSEDSVEWVNNELNVTDDLGTQWRYVRNQAAATQVWIYENGSYIGKLDIKWSGGSPSNAVFWGTASEWMDVNTSGNVTAAYAGGGSCTPEDYPDCEMPEFSFNSGCEEEAAARDNAAWDAVGVGLFAVVVSTTPMAFPAAVAFGVATGRAVGQLARWGLCVLMTYDDLGNVVYYAVVPACTPATGA